MMKRLISIATLVLLLLAGTLSSQAQTRLYGDVNSDGEVTITDVNAVIDVILGGSAPTPPPDPNGHEYVDLGLPSGTLWATCNIGASAPEEYGSYFAWGETSPKSHSDWNNYKWCINYGNDSYCDKIIGITKYCTDTSDGIADFKAELDAEDDAAYVNWGSLWRIPSRMQFRELQYYCTCTSTQRNGVNGLLVTGPNGNTMFLPAAGYRDEGSFEDVSERGCYWTRTLYTSYPSYAFDFEIYFKNDGYGEYDEPWHPDYESRIDEFTIRAVRVP